MFVDEAIITIEGGKGGSGVATFFPGYKTGPSGGDGGRGGDVMVKGDKNKIDLYQYVSKKKYKGLNGKNGENFRRTGANADPVIITVPIGTLFTNLETQESFEVEDVDTLHLLARGGRGGHGNAAFSSSTNQSPRQFQQGKDGQVFNYKMVLKLIAHFGLIGLPNAGKSSLLNELTAAQAKIGAYPFTTLEPNLGVYRDYILADIPGLIEGASQGKGLGVKFLKHIEKVQVLLHCISSESVDIKKDYDTIMNELGTYNQELTKKKQIILLTKTDLFRQDEIDTKIKILKIFSSEVYPLSIYDPEKVTELGNILDKALR